MPRTAVLTVDTNTKRVELIKPTAEQLNGEITSTKLMRNTDRKLVIRWILSGVRDRTGTAARFGFSATLEKETGALKIVAKPYGYDNDFRGYGSCDVS